MDSEEGRATRPSSSLFIYPHFSQVSPLKSLLFPRLQSVPGRSPEASLKKVELILQWRQEAGVGRMNASAPGTAAALARGAIFCSPQPSRSGRPVIMIRPKLMDWKHFDKAAEFSAHMVGGV